MKKSKPITAGELMDQLNSDPVYIAKTLLKDLQMKEHIEELRKDELPLIIDLVDNGFNVKSAWDFVNTAEKYPKAIPVLVKHLSKPYMEKNKEGIVRALTVKEAKGFANKALIQEYNKTDKKLIFLRFAMSNAMSVIAEPTDLSAIIEIVTNKENGESRCLFVTALAKIKSPEVENVLIELLDDKEINYFVIEALGKIKSKKALLLIEKYTESADKRIKKIALKVADRIKKSIK